MKVNTTTFLKRTVAAAGALVLLAGCGSSAGTASSAAVKGTVTIGIDDSAGNGPLYAQVSSMLACVTEDTLEIDGETYTLTKHYYTPEDAEAQVDDGTEVPDVTYTFTGTVESSDGGTYVLSPAESCTYNIKWGVVDTLGEGFAPTASGEGTSDDDASSLNWFYGPYLMDHGSNSDSVTVTITDGALSFEGFTFSE